MFKRIILGLFLAVAALAVLPQAALATTYTSCLRLNLPVPNDPAVTNIWGTLLNTNFSLLDTASGATGTISVAGSSNVVLTANYGATDQSRSANFVFTGTLTGNVYVLFPQSGCGSFSVKNSTSGAFTLSVAVNNGSSVPLGTSVPIPGAGTAELVSNGTDVRRRVDIIGLGAAASGANADITSMTGLISPLTILKNFAANTMLGNWTSGSANAAANAMPSCPDVGTNHLNYVNGSGVTCGTGSGTTGAAWRMSLSTNPSLITGVNPQELFFDTKTFDTANVCSTVTGRCTPTVAGKYRVTCMLALSAAPAGAGEIQGRVYILKNGATTMFSQLISGNSNSGYVVTPQANDIVSVNGSTDYISCGGFTNTSADGIIQGGVNTTIFNGSFVSP